MRRAGTWEEEEQGNYLDQLAARNDYLVAARWMEKIRPCEQPAVLFDSQY